MNKVVSQRIVKWCAKSINITQDEEVVIGYGITMVLETVQKFMLLVLLGMLVGQWFEVAIILFTFGSIRNHAGGLHMKTKAGCTLLMVCVVVLASTGKLILPIPNDILVLLGMNNIILLFMFAPADFNRYNERSKEQRNVCKIKAMFIMVIIFCLLLFIVDIKLRNIIVATSIIEIFTILPFWRKRG